MPGLVMWRRRHAAVRQALAPVRLSLELRAMAGSAMLCIDLLSERHLCDVARICAWVVAGRGPLRATGERGAQRRDAYGQPDFMNSLISFGEANTMEARSPCMPAPTATGFPGAGPSLLVSVLKRRLNSHTFSLLPSAVSTV